MKGESKASYSGEQRWSCSAPGSGGRVEGKHWRVTRWGEHHPRCAPCTSLSGGRKKEEGRGFTRQGGIQAVVSPKEEKAGEKGGLVQE